MINIIFRNPVFDQEMVASLEIDNATLCHLVTFNVSVSCITSVHHLMTFILLSLINHTVQIISLCVCALNSDQNYWLLVTGYNINKYMSFKSHEKMAHQLIENKKLT